MLLFFTSEAQKKTSSKKEPPVTTQTEPGGDQELPMCAQWHFVRTYVSPSGGICSEWVRACVALPFGPSYYEYMTQCGGYSSVDSNTSETDKEVLTVKADSYDKYAWSDEVVD